MTGTTETLEEYRTPNGLCLSLSKNALQGAGINVYSFAFPQIALSYYNAESNRVFVTFA